MTRSTDEAPVPAALSLEHQREAEGPSPGSVALIRPVASPGHLIQLHRQVAETIQALLVKGTDYGTIPGTDRPTLLKPGAERICFAFGVYPRYEVVDREIDHDRAVEWTKRKKVWTNEYRGDKRYTWQEETGTSRGLYRYEVRCTLVRREDGVPVAEGMGLCSTMESRYCDRPRDSENTVLKMAQKRALVAAVLNGFGLSDRFTQDLEDFVADGEAAKPEPSPAGEETGELATDAQRQLLARLMRSHVWTEDERRVAMRQMDGLTKRQMAVWIDRARAELSRRKQRANGELGKADTAGRKQDDLELDQKLAQEG